MANRGDSTAVCAFVVLLAAMLALTLVDVTDTHTVGGTVKSARHTPARPMLIGKIIMMQPARTDVVVWCDDGVEREASGESWMIDGKRVVVTFAKGRMNGREFRGKCVGEPAR